MGFFDFVTDAIHDVGEFFQDNVLDPGKKVIRELNKGAQYIQPALAAIPGIGPGLYGAAQGINELIQGRSSSSAARRTAPPVRTPATLPPTASSTMPWQYGGTAAVAPPSPQGAYYAHQAMQTPIFPTVAPRGYAIPPPPTYTSVSNNPWIGKSGQGDHCCHCCPYPRGYY